MERFEKATGGLVTAEHCGEQRRAAHRSDVVGRVTCAARYHVGRVVLEDEHGRFTGHARHATVDELVSDRVADHRNAVAWQLVDQREDVRRIQPTASIKLLRIASGRAWPGGIASSWAPWPVRTRIVRVPALLPAATSRR